jgi:uncharacterized membrane protein YgcG
MRAWARPVLGLALTAIVASIAAATVAAAGPPFPDPVAGQAVYAPAGAITAQTEQQLETKIDEIEARTVASARRFSAKP